MKNIHADRTHIYENRESEPIERKACFSILCLSLDERKTDFEKGGVTPLHSCYSCPLSRIFQFLFPHQFPRGQNFSLSLESPAVWGFSRMINKD